MKKGFSLIEVLIVVGIIGILASIVLYNVAFTTKKGRDTKRIADITISGRFFAGGECRAHSLGEDTPIDLTAFAEELTEDNPQYEKFLKSIPIDPKTGTDTESNYYYIYSGGDCVIYTNLENLDEEITLSHADPTPGGGQGVLQGQVIGPNGTDIYYQFSN